MKTHHQMNQYLEELNQHLFALGESERGKIITHLKENILNVLTLNPTLTAKDLLHSLGSAKQLSNAYLISKGLAPAKMTEGRSTLKIFTIFLLTCISLIILGVSFLIHKFSPFINLDSQKGKVSFFGDSLIFTSPPNANNLGQATSQSTQFNGEQLLDLNSIDSVLIQFDSGHFSVSQSDTSKITWKCELKNETDSANTIPTITKEIKSFHLDFNEIAGTICQLQIPRGLHFSLTGNSGSVTLSKIQFHAYVEMENGEVEWENDPNRDYKFLLNITNGQIDQFESSDKADSYKVEIKLENGSIIHK
ncbi:MAG: hypothetical protein QE271_06335 [Bacteriovoracaceae bacterium]|nr:hypothetical protein [Bacteriovoracaceae bacterium]